MTVTVMSALVRPLVEPHLPAGIEARFYSSVEEMHALAGDAEIGWFDMNEHAPMIEAVRRAEKLRWLNSIFAGLDFLPLDLLERRGVTITHGVGINADAVAEYAVLGMLALAKGYRQVMQAQDRHEWLMQPPATGELHGSRALILGYGAIGQGIGARLAPFGVECVPVRRTGGNGALGMAEWRDRLGEFDWVLLAVPATPDTDGMIGAREIAAMRPGARLVNVARGTVIDQAALTRALAERRLGGAFLDVTDPEPLPPDDPLWDLPNVHITAHLSGRSQSSMFRRSAERFVANLRRWNAGEEVAPRFDYARGY